ncbi:hypothetical protein N0V93_005481 [Gnomoniopsis smithogilvyi]|uniref:N-acetyltransferase domain-containing protein n=1 Tax=Gnomoniopsis smithogilvyi TaxID=1191159 RepID=A0A9W8YUJ8_9PEZI|nr:hypothetical protein N0V93_005481 [Gnomoniopsis smithogilvyi]
MDSLGRSIRIRDATVDDSLQAIARVYFEGFSTTVLHQRLFPGGGSPSAKEKYMCRLRKDVSLDPFSTSPVRVIVKVAELLPHNGEEPKIIALAKWKFVKESLPVEMWKVKKQDVVTEEEVGEGVNLELWRTFNGKMQQFQAEAMRGDRCLHLGSLVCHPDYRGLGAARALLQWGVELADKERIPAFLEASPHCYPLYKRFGFQDIGMYEFALPDTGLIDDKDLGAEMCPEWGAKPKGFLRAAIMRRLPR